MTQGPSAEARLAQAERRRVSDLNDRQVALYAAVQMHVGIGSSDADEVTETAEVFLRFLETGEASTIR